MTAAFDLTTLRGIAVAMIAATMLAAPAAAENRIDRTRPDAPALAPFGDTPIGVRTITLEHKNQIDILNVEAGKPLPRYDRALTVEVWYPAVPGGTPVLYRVQLRDGQTEVDIHGRAVRDAEPARPAAPLPLVILSHGYPGNRFLMSPLAENLATKGYVVVSIDHRDSTYGDKAAFGSTLVNRPLDQMFVLNEMARLGADPTSFLSGLVDAGTTGLIGYSMGGYGAVISAGGGVTQASTELTWGAPAGTLAVHLARSQSHAALVDPRLKAVIAIAPWGMERGFWDADGLGGIAKPILFIAGDADDVSGYEKGTKAIYEGAVNAPRALLTFENANHNAAAPMPAPEESWQPVASLDFVPFDHYADPVWDTVRMNNIAQHFATAFMGKYLKADAGMEAYLTLTERSNDGVFALNDDGSAKPEHSYWTGFPDRTAKGLQFRRANPK